MNTGRAGEKTKSHPEGYKEKALSPEGEEEVYGEEEWYYEEEEQYNEGEGEEEQPREEADEEIETVAMKESSFNIKTNFANSQLVAVAKEGKKEAILIKHSPEQKETTVKATPYSLASKQLFAIPPKSGLWTTPNQQIKPETSSKKRSFVQETPPLVPISSEFIAKSHSRLPSRSEVVKVTELYPEKHLERSAIKLVPLLADTSKEPRLSMKLPGAYSRPLVIDNSLVKPADTKRNTPSNTIAMLREVVGTGTKSPHVAPKPLRLAGITPVSSINQSPRMNSDRGPPPGFSALNVPSPGKQISKTNKEDTAQKASQSNNSFSSVYNSPQKVLASSNNGSTAHLPSLQIAGKQTFSRQGSIEDVLADAFPSLKKQDSVSKYTISKKDIHKTIDAVNLSKPRLFFNPSPSRTKQPDLSVSRRNSIILRETEREKVSEAPYGDLPSVTKSIGRSRPKGPPLAPSTRPNSRTNLRGAFNISQLQDRVVTQPTEDRRKFPPGNYSLNVSIVDNETIQRSLAKELLVSQFSRKFSGENHQRKNTESIVEGAEGSQIRELSLNKKANQYIAYCSKEIELTIPDLETLNKKGVDLTSELEKLSASLRTKTQSSALVGKKFGGDLPSTYSKSTMNYLIMRYSKDIETNKNMLTNLEKELDRTETVLANIKKPG